MKVALKAISKVLEDKQEDQNQATQQTVLLIVGERVGINISMGIYCKLKIYSIFNLLFILCQSNREL
jgi:hypothetical protein